MRRRRRLRDLFAGRTAPPDADARPQSYEVFDTLLEAKVLVERWRKEYDL